MKKYEQLEMQIVFMTEDVVRTSPVDVADFSVKWFTDETFES